MRVHMYMDCGVNMDGTDYTMIYRIAKSYYTEGLSQQEIAKREHISRPHVSRMLAKAREAGIVHIRIEMPQELRLPELQRELCARLSLREVVLAYVPEERKCSQADVSLDIATVAADCLPSLLAGVSSVGIGWGYTVYQTALLLNPYDGGDITFVPLIGISGENNPYLQINVLVNRFAEKFGASSHYTNMPVIRSSSVRLEDIEKERGEQLATLWGKLDAAIVGLGPPVREGEFPLVEASGEYRRMLAQGHLVGDILANYYDRNGNVFDSSAYYEHFSLPLTTLRAIPRVICLAEANARWTASSQPPATDLSTR